MFPFNTNFAFGQDLLLVQYDSLFTHFKFTGLQNCGHKNNVLGIHSFEVIFLVCFQSEKKIIQWAYFMTPLIQTNKFEVSLNLLPHDITSVNVTQ